MQRKSLKAFMIKDYTEKVSLRTLLTKRPTYLLMILLRPIIFVCFLTIPTESLLWSIGGAEPAQYIVYHNEHVKEMDIPVLTKLTGYAEIRSKNGGYNLIKKS